MTDLLKWDRVESVRAADWPWSPLFTPPEFACRGTGQIAVDPAFMDRLVAVRQLCGFPFPVTSGYRAPVYNLEVSSTGLTGPHTTGHAVDLGLYGGRALMAVERALSLGFTGVGLKQRGPRSGRFIHLDDLSQSAGVPRPWIWTY